MQISRYFEQPSLEIDYFRKKLQGALSPSELDARDYENGFMMKEIKVK